MQLETDNDRDELVLYFNNILKNLKYEDLEFYKILLHWKPYILSTCFSVGGRINEDPVDVLSTILVSLVKLNSTYAIPLYRYDGGVYECVGRSGPIMNLASPRFNKKIKDPVAAHIRSVEEVNKASLDSLVYKKIGQCASSLIRNSFTKKKGFIRSAAGELYKLPDISLQDLIVSHENLRFDDVISNEDVKNGNIVDNQEDTFVYAQMKEQIYDSLSWPARAVFTQICADPGLSASRLSRMLGLSFKHIRYAHREIALVTEKLLDDDSFVDYTRNLKVKPVYLRSDLVCL